MRGKKYQKQRKLDNQELQIKIAKHIIRNGIQSPFDVKNNFNISSVLANKTFRSMVTNNYIQCVKEVKISGGTRKYYNFKQDGIDWILENGNIHFEDFWNLLFLIYNEKYDLKKFESIEIIINKFEKSRQINREYFFLYDHFAELANIGKLVTNEKMINKENREKMFYSTVKPIFQNIILNKKPVIDDDVLLELDVRRIINTIHNKKTKLYHLTPFGDMLLLYCFYDMSINMEKIDFSHIKEKLAKKYDMVFSHWELIKKITNLTDTSLIKCFLNLHVRKANRIFDQHKKSMKMYGGLGFDDDVELLRMFYFMQNRMKFQIKKEFKSATKVIQNWAQNEQFMRILFDYHKMPSKYIKLLALIGDENCSKNQLKEILTKSVKFNQSLLQHDDWYHEKFGKKLKKDKLERTKEEEEFLNPYRNEPKPNTKTIKKVLNVIKPITKYAELYNFMVPRDPELYLSKTTSRFFSNKIYNSLYNIISFQFFLILKLGTHPKKWEDLMSRKEMKTVKVWFDDWIRIIADFYSDIINNIREHKSDYSEYWNMQNPVFLEAPLMYKENLLPDDPNIKDAF